MKVKQLVLALALCLVILGSSLLVVATTSDEDAPEFLVYRMWNIQVLLIRGTESLAKDAGPLTEAKKAELADEVRDLDCACLPELARYDCKAWRATILSFLASPPASDFEWGRRIGEIMRERFIPILVDIGVTEQKAREDLQRNATFGYSEELASTLGGALNLTQAVFLLGQGLRDECPKNARLEAYYFVVYQAIDLAMYGEAKSGKRPIEAQAALLAMDPATIFKQTHCNAFQDLHNSLMSFFWAINRNPLIEQVEQEYMRSSIYFVRVVKEAKLSDQDIIDAGGKEFLDLVHLYRSF